MFQPIINKIYETICLFGKTDKFLTLNFNVTFLSLNNISEFKKKTNYCYKKEQLYCTNLDAGLRYKVKFTENYMVAFSLKISCCVILL